MAHGHRGPVEVDAVREAYGRDGFVVLRGLIEAAVIDSVAASITAILRAAGIEETAGEPGTATVDPYRDRSLYAELYGLEALHAIGRSEALLEAVKAVTGSAQLFVHPNPALRLVPPTSGNADTTPPHQDVANMRGTERAVIAWLALRECPTALGPIEVLRSSHLGGVRPTTLRPGARVLGCEVGPDEQLGWFRTDLEPGDVVLCSVLSVHRAQANRGTRWRYSVDFRYQDPAEEIWAPSLAVPKDLDLDTLTAKWGDRALATSMRSRPGNVVD